MCFVMGPPHMYFYSCTLACQPFQLPSFSSYWASLGRYFYALRCEPQFDLLAMLPPE